MQYLLSLHEFLFHQEYQGLPKNQSTFNIIHHQIAKLKKALKTIEKQNYVIKDVGLYEVSTTIYSACNMYL